MSVKAPIRYIKYNYYFPVKTTLNRDLQFSRDDAFLIYADNLFHKVGVGTLTHNHHITGAETVVPAIVSDWMT